MTVTMREILHAAELRSASLVAELSGYLVLGAADRIIGAPRTLHAADVSLESDGSVQVTGGGASEDEHAERSLRCLLGYALSVSRAGAPAVHRAASSTSSVGVRGLVAELEAGLIPVNRAAARRALARLHREVVRAQQAGDLDQEPRGAWVRAEREGATDLASASARSADAAPEAPSELAVTPDVTPESAKGGASAWRSTSTGQAETVGAGLGQRVKPRPAPVSLEPTDVSEEDVTTRPLGCTGATSVDEAGELTEPCALPVVVECTVPIELPDRSARNAGPGPARARSVSARADVQVTQPIHVVPRSTDATPHSIGVDAPDPAARQEDRVEPPTGGPRRSEMENHSGSESVLPLRPRMSGERTSHEGERGPSSAATQEDGAKSTCGGEASGREVAVGSQSAESAARFQPDELEDADAEDVLGLVLTPSPHVGEAEGTPGARQLPTAPRVFAPRRSDVRRLIDDFATSDVRSDGELCRELQQLAGVDATPGNLPRVQQCEQVEVVEPTAPPGRAKPRS